MNRAEVIDQLRVVLGDMNGAAGVIEKVQECPSADVVFRTRCYVIFFVTVEKSQLLLPTYRQAEAEIVRVLAFKGSDWPRDINLVLLVTEATHIDSSVARGIIDDRHACRKFVLEVGQSGLQSAMSRLPFGPLQEKLNGEPISVAAGVQEALRGYDPRLVTDLMSQSPGVDRISERIMEGFYAAPGDSVEKTAAPRIRRISSGPVRLSAIDISDFRGIRRLSGADMDLDADVVFIYGPNGVGKTSIADAIEWAVTGQVERLERSAIASHQGEIDPIVNVFASEAEARVALHLKGCEPISRTKRGRSVERSIGSRVVPDDRSIIEHIARAHTESIESRLKIERLRSLFRGSHKLSQHDIRQFLERTSATDRFDILTTMIGAEEYVRFRQKVTSVAKTIRSANQNLQEERALHERELREATERLAERQKEIDRLNAMLISEGAATDLASRFAKDLREYLVAEAGDGLDESTLQSVQSELNLLVAFADDLIGVCQRSCRFNLSTGSRSGGRFSGASGYHPPLGKSILDPSTTKVL